MISFTNYLHERAEESRHNESVSLLLGVLGTVLLVGGILETSITASNMQWFLFFPYHLSETSGVLGLGLTVVGFVLFIFGIGLAIHYASQRAWYFDELRRAYSVEEGNLKSKGKKKSVGAKKDSEYARRAQT